MRQASTATEDRALEGRQGSRFAILMMPDFREGNPYQSLLSKAISDLGCNVSFPEGYRRIFPLFRALRHQGLAVNVLHLHWLAPYLRGKTLASYFIYALKLYVDVCLVRLSGVRIVWTIHNQLSHEARFPRVERWLMRRVASLASRIIVHSQAALSGLTQEMDLSLAKTVVIPHGHYREVYHAPVDQRVARRQLRLPANGLVYLCFGLVRRYKNIEGLIRGWNQNPGLARGAVLLIAGEVIPPGYDEEIRRLAQNNNKIIKHLRHIPAEQVHLYFSAADVVVLPFHRTLTSGSLLLAMSFAKPIVAPRFDVIAEALGPAGELLYDPLDDDGLCRALGMAASADLASIARRTGHQCDEISWSAVAQETFLTYGASCRPA